MSVTTLTGAPLTREHKPPRLRLIKDELDQIASEERSLRAPIDDAVFRLGAEVTRLLCMSGGNIDGAVDRIEQEIADRLALYAQQQAECGNE